MQKSKSALFLMELIIIIMFFALTSAVCMQVFVKAHEISRISEAGNNAMLWSTNARECFYAYDGDEILIEKALSDSFYSNDYSYELDFFEEDGFSCMTFSFYKKNDNSLIYSYTFRQHIAEVISHE